MSVCAGLRISQTLSGGILYHLSYIISYHKMLRFSTFRKISFFHEIEQRYSEATPFVFFKSKPLDKYRMGQ